jgi:regulatory protein
VADADADPAAGVAADPAAEAARIVPRRTGDAGLWRSTWDGATTDDSPTESDQTAEHPSRGRGAHSIRRLRAVNTVGDTAPVEVDPEAIRRTGEEVLVRKLRSKSLSVAEARTVLRGVEVDGERLSAAQIDDVIDDFSRRGYLDDVTLAWHLVTTGAERKGQGRIALSRALAQRGIPREVIDQALAELPDDDAERALEFARSKARTMTGLDRDTALRRLLGQLARRGYSGPQAMTAATTALAETSGRPATGVRFVDSE